MQITAEPLTSEEFVPFGQVIQKSGAENYKINNGKCTRYHELATVESSVSDAMPIVNIFSGEPYELPLEVTMVERHPFGSQAFYPLSDNPYLVLVCHDREEVPIEPRAFLASKGQGVNIGRNVWHGVLTPLLEKSDFLVVDLGGVADNLNEFELLEPITVLPPKP